MGDEDGHGRQRLKDGGTRRFDPADSMGLMRADPAPKTFKPKSSLIVRWLIDSMTLWDRESIDAEVRGNLDFGPRGLASFQFGRAQGQHDSRIGERDSKPAVEFPWNGRDERD